MLFVALGSLKEKEKIANLTKRFRAAGTATAKEKTHGSKRQSPIKIAEKWHQKQALPGCFFALLARPRPRKKHTGQNGRALAWENACRFGASPLEAGSETPEQQQDSSPCQAKRSPTKCFPSPLEPIKKQFFLGARLVPKPLAQVPWRRRSDKMLSPCQAKPGPTKCFPLPLEPINTSAFVRHPSCGRSSETIGASPLEAGSETPEQQQDSSPCQAKRTPKKCLTLPLESIKEDTKQPLAERPRELESPASKAFGGAPPKHSNSGRIRTHATQKAHRKSA